MRHILKSIIISLATAYIAYKLVPTINFGQDPRTILLFIGGIWTIAQIVNPIFSIVLLPINLLTFGFVSFLLYVAFVFALMNFVPGFSILPYNFPGANINGFIIPSMSFNQISTILLVALVITIIQKALHIIFE